MKLGYHIVSLDDLNRKVCDASEMRLYDSLICDVTRVERACESRPLPDAPKEAALDEARHPSSGATTADVGVAAKSGLANITADRGFDMSGGVQSVPLKYMGDDRFVTGDVDKDQKFILALTYRDSQAKQEFNKGMGGNYGRC